MRSIAIGLLCLAAATAASQGSNGVDFSAGIGIDPTGAYSASVSYFHPLPLRQFYAVGGLSLTEEIAHYDEPIPFPAGSVRPAYIDSRFSETQRVFIGIQTGDYVFILPKLSYNFYGRYSSPGWGFAGGLLLHPTHYFGVGFHVSYDRARFEKTLDSFGPVETITFSLAFRVKFHE